MTQRQLNMIQAIQDGIRLARQELTGPGSDRALSVVLDEFLDDGPRTMSLAAAAYYAAMLMAWQDRGCPDLPPANPATDPTAGN